MQPVFLDLLFAEEDSVSTVQVLDNTAFVIADQLRMVAADELALDVNLVVRSPSDDDAARRKIQFLHDFAVVAHLDPSHTIV